MEKEPTNPAERILKAVLAKLCMDIVALRVAQVSLKDQTLNLEEFKQSVHKPTVAPKKIYLIKNKIELSLINRHADYRVVTVS